MRIRKSTERAPLSIVRDSEPERLVWWKSSDRLRAWAKVSVAAARLGRRTDGGENHIGGVGRDRRQQPHHSPAHGETGEAQPDGRLRPLPGGQVVHRRAEHERRHHTQTLAGQGHGDRRDQTQSQLRGVGSARPAGPGRPGPARSAVHRAVRQPVRPAPPSPLNRLVVRTVHRVSPWAEIWTAHDPAQRAETVIVSSLFARRPGRRRTRLAAPTAVFGVFQPGHGAIVDLIRTVGDAQGADHGVHLGQRRVGRDAGAAKRPGWRRR